MLWAWFRRPNPALPTEKHEEIRTREDPARQGALMLTVVAPAGVGHEPTPSVRRLWRGRDGCQWPSSAWKSILGSAAMSNR